MSITIDEGTKVNDEQTYLLGLKKVHKCAVHKAWTRNETVTCHKQDAKPLIVLKLWRMSHISVSKYELPLNIIYFRYYSLRDNFVRLKISLPNVIVFVTIIVLLFFE